MFMLKNWQTASTLIYYTEAKIDNS